MQELIKKPIFRQFVKFGVVGATSFIIDAGVYFIATRYFGIFYCFSQINFFLDCGHQLIYLEPPLDISFGKS